MTYTNQANQDYSEQELFDYLNELRDSGKTNMFGAPRYLQTEFGLCKKDSQDVFWAWTEQF